MRFLVKLSIGLLLFFVQVGFSWIAQSETTPFLLPLIVALLYGAWCESYILGFFVGFASAMAYPFAVNLWYSLQGYTAETWSVFFRNAFLGFFILGIIFGIIGIVSARFRLWLRKINP